jgi:hypothetical protein
MLFPPSVPQFPQVGLLVIVMAGTASAAAFGKFVAVLAVSFRAPSLAAFPIGFDGSAPHPDQRRFRFHRPVPAVNQRGTGVTAGDGAGALLQA